MSAAQFFSVLNEATEVKQPWCCIEVHIWKGDPPSARSAVIYPHKYLFELGRGVCDLIGCGYGEAKTYSDVLREQSGHSLLAKFWPR